MLSLMDYLNPIKDSLRSPLLAHVNNLLAKAQGFQPKLIIEMHTMIAIFCSIAVAFPVAFTEEYIPAILNAFSHYNQLVSRSGELLPLDVAASHVAAAVGVELPSQKVRRQNIVKCFDLIYILSLRAHGVFVDKLIATGADFLERFPEFDSNTKDWLRICKEVDPRFKSADECQQGVRPFKASKKWCDRFHTALDDKELQRLVEEYNVMIYAVQLTNDKETRCVDLAVNLVEGTEFRSGGDNGPIPIRRKYLHKRLELLKKEWNLHKALRSTKIVGKRETRHVECPVEGQSKKIKRSHTYPRDSGANVSDSYRVFGFASTMTDAIHTQFPFPEIASFPSPAPLNEETSSQGSNELAFGFLVEKSDFPLPCTMDDDSLFEECPKCGEFWCVSCDSFSF